MCDETTERENAAYLLSRRQLGRVAGAALASSLVAGCATTGQSTAKAAAPAGAPAKLGEQVKTRGRIVTIKTPDGEAQAFFVAAASGRSPGVLVWPDVAGLRRAYEVMAARLAARGFAVLTVNPYYRSSRLPLLETFSQWRTDAGRARIAPMRAALTPAAITRDAKALTAWLDAQPEVDTKRKLATMGYCMGGPFTFRTAAAAPSRVGVIASFHGGRLVTEAPDSPHRLLAKSSGQAALICIAHNDHARQPEAKVELDKAAARAGAAAEIEVYPAQHGWCAIDSPVYDKAQAERAFGRTLAMFREHL